MWTDESRFSLDFHDGRIRVHRLPGERFSACCIKEHDRYGGGSVMLWAGVWHGGRTLAIRVQGTMTGERYHEIVTSVVIPTATQHGLVFQDDNATPHRTAKVKATVAEAGILTLSWPARSPDLSPIEHAWDELGRRLRDSYSIPPTNLGELSQRLTDQWNRMDQASIDRLCDSMPQRLEACIRARGGHTQY